MCEESDRESLPNTGMINVTDADERRRWAKAFGVSEASLLKAVKLVGSSVRELRKLFGKD